METLATVVYSLLIGHVTDPKLDMANVLKLGLTAVLAALSQPSDELTTAYLKHLACFFLRRVATDRRAFQALYGRRTYETQDVTLTGWVRNDPAIEALWSLLCKSFLAL